MTSTFVKNKTVPDYNTFHMMTSYDWELFVVRLIALWGETCYFPKSWRKQHLKLNISSFQRETCFRHERIWHQCYTLLSSLEVIYILEMEPWCIYCYIATFQWHRVAGFFCVMFVSWHWPQRDHKLFPSEICKCWILLCFFFFNQ